MVLPIAAGTTKVVFRWLTFQSTIPKPNLKQQRTSKMKIRIQFLSTLAIATLLATQVNAGPPPPPVTTTTEVSGIYGTGWYAAIHLGANVWQDRADTLNFVDAAGNTLRIEPKTDTGFYGGVKFGYVFGTGGCRFALEEDLFYNGWQTGADSTLVVNGVTTNRNTSIDINSGVFMTNGILRFGTGRFQPYIGAGIGAYYAESAGGNFGPFTTGGGGSHGDFAWNALAGADYYFNPKTSVFIEYKFLEYTAEPDWGDRRAFGQQLVGAGLRFHF